VAEDFTELKVQVGVITERVENIKAAVERLELAVAELKTAVVEQRGDIKLNAKMISIIISMGGMAGAVVSALLKAWGN